MDVSSNATVKNILASFLQFGVRFIIGILFIRFLIESLGPELYGMVALSNNFINYYALITLVMNAPAGRYLIVAMSRNQAEAKVVFNSFFWGLSVLSGIVMVFSIGVAIFAPYIFKIPAVHHADVRVLFLATGITFSFSTLFNAFGLSTYVTNKLYLNSFKEIIRDIVRVTIVFLLIVLFHWKINAIATGIVCSAFISILLSLVYWKALTPELTINYNLISITKLKEMIGFGGWVFINQIGALLFLNTEILIVNLLYGAKMTGMYAPLLLFSSTIRTMAAMLNNTLAPMIFDRYSRDDKEGLLKLACRAIRFLGLTIVLPIGLVSGFSKSLLFVWLGPEFSEFRLILMVLTIHLCVNLTVTPLFHIQVAFKKVKIPALVTLVMGIVNVLLAFLLGSPQFGIGLIGVALAGAISLTLKNAFFTPFYTGFILGQNNRMIINAVASVITGFLYVFLLSITVEKIYFINNLFELILSFSVISSTYLVLAWFILLPKDEKVWFKNIFFQMIFKIKNVG